MFWLVAATYALVLIVISLWASRRGAHSQDKSGEYYLSGSGVGWTVTGLTYAATGFSASTVIGTVGLAYASGWAITWLIVGAALGFGLCFTVFAPRIWRLARSIKALTAIDLIQHRFKSRPLTAVSSVMVVFFFIPYLAVQFIGSGILFSTFLGYPAWAAILVFGIFVIAYVYIGGFRAVVYTDAFQGGLLLVGFISFATLGLVRFDFGEMVASFEAAVPGGATSPTGTMTALEVLGLTLPFVLGYAGMPMMITRFMSLGSKRDVPFAGLIACLLAIAAGVFMVIAVGMAHILLEPVEILDHVFPLLVIEVFPPVLAAGFLTVLLAAMMSTADSILHVCGTTLSRDLYQRYIKPDVTDKRLVTVTRVSVAIVGAFGIGFALLPNLPVLQLVVQWTFGVYASTMTFVIIGVCYWRRMTAAAAMGAIIVGAVVYVGSNLLGEPGVPAVILAIACVIPTVLLLSYLPGMHRRPSPPKQEEVLELAEER